MLNGALDSLSSMTTLPIRREAPSLVTSPIQPGELGTLIGVTGAVRGRIIFDGTREVFSVLGEGLFGMKVEGDMLDSLAGEIGNVVCGNMATHIAEQGITIDITPPTVFRGEVTLSGFAKALAVPVHIQNVGCIRILLALENN